MLVLLLLSLSFETDLMPCGGPLDCVNVVFIVSVVVVGVVNVNDDDDAAIFMDFVSSCLKIE